MLRYRMNRSFLIARSCDCAHIMILSLLKRWNEDVHGSIDTNANRRTNPQGFSWTCCGENGATSRGCCDNRGSTLEELYASSTGSENEASQDEGVGTVDGSDEDDTRSGLHDGKLEIDTENDSWAVNRSYTYMIFDSNSNSYCA